MIFGRAFDSVIHKPKHNEKLVSYLKYNNYVEGVKLWLTLLCNSVKTNMLSTQWIMVVD